MTGLSRRHGPTQPAVRTALQAPTARVLRGFAGWIAGVAPRDLCGLRRGGADGVRPRLTGRSSGAS